MPEKIKLSLILLFFIMLSCASSEEFSAKPGEIPRPLLLSSDTTGKIGNLNQGLEDLEASGLKQNSTDSRSNLSRAGALGAMKEIIVQLYAGNYKVTKDKDGYDCIEMEGFADKYIPGEPLLPCGISKVLLPPNVDYSTLKLEIVSEEKQLLDGTYNIRPAPEDLPQNQDFGLLNETYKSEAIKSKVYSVDAAYPVDYVKLLPPSQMRKWQFVPVEFVPLGTI
jgi:hypothetical protein